MWHIIIFSLLNTIAALSCLLLALCVSETSGTVIAAKKIKKKIKK